jgi:hypothetical protein
VTLDQEALIYGMERRAGESDPDFECRIAWESNPNNIIPARPYLTPHHTNSIQGMLLATVLSLPIWILIGVCIYYGIVGPR